MATTVVRAYVATINAGNSTAASAYWTHTIAVTAGFEARVPIRWCGTTDNSAGPEIYAYRAALIPPAGTAPYETEGRLKYVFPRTSNATKTKVVELDTGMWVLAVLNGGPWPATFMCLTQEVITAYI